MNSVNNLYIPQTYIRFYKFFVYVRNPLFTYALYLIIIGISSFFPSFLSPTLTKSLRNKKKSVSAVGLGIVNFVADIQIPRPRGFERGSGITLLLNATVTAEQFIQIFV